MTKNRLGIILSVFMILALVFNTVSAASIIDTQTYSDIYKVSEDASEFKLPFIRFADGRIEVDKEISQDGIFISQSGIEVTKPIDGIQVLYSGDTVRLNADTEYTAIFSNGNVIISGIVQKTTMIYCTGEITIDEGANVKGNLIVYTPTLNINSDVDGNIIGYVATLNLNKVVDGQVRIKAEEVNVSEDGKVNGEFYISTTNKELSVEGANIEVIENSTKANFKNYVVKLLNTTIIDIAIYLLILIFVKKDKLQKLVEKLDNSKKVIKNGVWSLLVIILSILLGFALVMLLPKLGAASMVFGIAALIIVALLENVVVVTLVTEMAINKYEGRNVKPNRIVTAIVSFLIINLVRTIPFVGGILNALLFILASGMVVTLFLGNLDNKTIKAEVVDNKE